ncbi:BTB/POZ domain-containing protein [Glycine soja]
MVNFYFTFIVLMLSNYTNSNFSFVYSLSFVDTLEKWCRICQKDIADPFQGEPVSRAVLVMIHSPRNSISSQARFLLLDVLNAKGLSCLKKSYGSFDKLQLVINLIGLTCLSSLPEYQRCIIESKGIKAIALLQIAVEVNKRKKRSAVRRFFKKDMADLLGSSLDYNAYGRQIAVEVNKRKKRSAVQRFLKKDMADLLGSSLDYNAYGMAVMEALKETETSMRIVGNRKDFAEGAKKIEYFEETTLLLSTILWCWPPSRFPVGNDVILMKVLANIHTRTDTRKLIEDGEVFPQILSFVDTLEKWCRICQKDIADPFQGEPVSRAVLLIAVEVNKRKKRSAVRRFLKKDMPDLLGSSLDYNAYGRMEKCAMINWCALDSLSGDAHAARHAIVKEPVADILGAHYYGFFNAKHGIRCGSKEVATPCANALNLVISNLSATSEKAVMEALKETETSMRIVGNRKDFAEGAKKIEYFEETTLLLSTILWRWPPSRKRIEDGEVFPQMFVPAMGKSDPHAVRIEGFRLAQCLLRSQENCLKVVGLCGEALVDAIICGMKETGLSSK